MNRQLERMSEGIIISHEAVQGRPLEVGVMRISYRNELINSSPVNAITTRNIDKLCGDGIVLAGRITIPWDRVQSNDSPVKIVKLFTDSGPLWVVRINSLLTTPKR